MIATAEERGFYRQKMNAQAYLKEFYAQFGFRTHGNLFREADMDHYRESHMTNA